jgi:hypothetical protein
LNNFEAKECEGASGNLLQISTVIFRASVCGRPILVLF